MRLNIFERHIYRSLHSCRARCARQTLLAENFGLTHDRFAISDVLGGSMKPKGSVSSCSMQTKDFPGIAHRPSGQ